MGGFDVIVSDPQRSPAPTSVPETGVCESAPRPAPSQSKKTQMAMVPISVQGRRRFTSLGASACTTEQHTLNEDESPENFGFVPRQAEDFGLFVRQIKRRSTPYFRPIAIHVFLQEFEDARARHQHDGINGEPGFLTDETNSLPRRRTIDRRSKSNSVL